MGPKTCQQLVLLHELHEEKHKGDFDIYVAGRWIPACFSGESAVTLTVNITVPEKVRPQKVIEAIENHLDDTRLHDKLGIITLSVTGR
jgi:hypothetical protein